MSRREVFAGGEFDALKEAIETFQRLTAEMRSRAERQDTEDMDILEKERESCLGTLEQLIAECEEIPAFVREELEAVLEANRKMIDWAERMREESASELRQFRQGRKAQRAYAQNTSAESP